MLLGFTEMMTVIIISMSLSLLREWFLNRAGQQMHLSAFLVDKVA